MPYKDLQEYEVFNLYKDYIFPPLDDIRPQGFAEVIRKCWNEEYTSISALQSDLDEISWHLSLEMSNGVGGASNLLPKVHPGSGIC
jgi:hypothetical protein